MELRKLLPRGFDEDIIFDNISDDSGAGAEALDKQIENKAKSSATFAYGKAVGAGVQEFLITRDMSKAIFATFLTWDVDLADESQVKVKKTFEAAVLAVMKFRALESLAINLEDYELMYHEGKPCVELSFRITLPNGFKYRGFIDAVLRNKYTDEIIVFECKTTGMRWVNAAQYQNSEQGVSYALVLDKLFGKLSSYSVLYCAYLSSLEKWETFLFPKSPTQRMEWFQNTFDDVQTVQRWIDSEYFPRRGESCMAYGRACEYIDTCHLDLNDFYLDTHAANKVLAAEERPGLYQVEITLQELIDAQIELTEEGN
jgi:hypothetical protein